MTTGLLLRMPTQTGYCSHKKHSVLIEGHLIVKLLGNTLKPGTMRQVLLRSLNPPIQRNPHK